MSADREVRLEALRADGPFVLGENGVISNGAGAAVMVKGRDRLRVEAVGSGLRVDADHLRASAGVTGWGIAPSRLTAWSDGPAAGEPIDAVEREAVVDCLRRAFAAVGRFLDAAD